MSSCLPERITCCSSEEVSSKLIEVKIGNKSKGDTCIIKSPCYLMHISRNSKVLYYIKYLEIHINERSHLNLDPSKNLLILNKPTYLHLKSFRILPSHPFASLLTPILPDLPLHCYITPNHNLKSVFLSHFHSPLVSNLCPSHLYLNIRCNLLPLELIHLKRMLSSTDELASINVEVRLGGFATKEFFQALQEVDKYK